MNGPVLGPDFEACSTIVFRYLQQQNDEFKDANNPNWIGNEPQERAQTCPVEALGTSLASDFFCALNGVPQPRLEAIRKHVPELPPIQLLGHFHRVFQALIPTSLSSSLDEDLTVFDLELAARTQCSGVPPPNAAEEEEVLRCLDATFMYLLYFLVAEEWIERKQPVSIRLPLTDIFSICISN